MTEELEVLKTLTERLESAGIAYMVTGSIAMNYYAVPRMTRDIDVVVELSAADADRVCALFEGDFYVDRAAARAASAERGIFNLIHLAYVIKADFIVRKEGEYRLAEFARRLLHRGARGSDYLQARLGARHTLGGSARRCAQPADVGLWSGCGVSGSVDGPPRAQCPVSRGHRMKDTGAEMEQKYREMLLARSCEERLRIGCSMHATAQALVRASVLAKDPLASPGELRRALFLRFHGQEFAAVEREKIMAWLSREAPELPQSPRRVPVDWDDLEMALTSNAGEWACYLDVRSGEVQMVPVDRFGGDDWPSEEQIEAEFAAGHLIQIEPLDSSVEYAWMAEFAASVRDARVRSRLEIALDGRGAFRRFKNVLAGHPAEREQWFAFRDMRVHAAAREWLTEEGIEPTTAPRRRQQ